MRAGEGGSREDDDAMTGIAARLWAGALPLAARSLHHPFVLRLAGGSLERASFQAYVAQDAFFLKAFAQAYALALSRSTELESIEELSSLIGGVVDELKLHRSYAAKWGIDVVDVQPNPATSAYTHFLLTLARDEDVPVAVVLAAMTPCMRLYAYLGTQLRAACPDASHAYAEWLDAYAAPEFGALARRIEGLLDRAAVGVPLEPMRAAYERAMQLELDFFDAQPGVAPVAALLPPGRRALLAVDFDETVSTAQTLEILVELAARAAEAARARGDARGVPGGAQGVRERWAALAEPFAAAYAAAFDDALELLQRGGGGSGAAPVEPGGVVLGVAALERFVSDFSAFETSAVAPVSFARVLQGIPEPELVTTGAQMAELRPGFAPLVRALLSDGQLTKLHVISVNWASQLVFGSVARALGGAGRGVLSVHANPMPVAPPPGGGGGPPLTTGEIATEGGIHSAVDKRSIFRQLLRAEAEAEAEAGGGGGGGGGGAALSVYVGDSLTDICALLEADVGVLIGSSGSVRKALRALGVCVRPIVGAAVRAAAAADDGAPWRPSPAYRPGQGEARPPAEPATVYEVSSWHELHACLRGWRALAELSGRPLFVLPGAGAGLEGGGAELGGAAPGGGAPSGAAARPRGSTTLPVVLSIAGSDSGGGAGIQADLKTCAALGVFGTTALAGLTAQNTAGVHAIEAVSAEFVTAQLEAVLGDFDVGAIKTGMLPSAAVIRAVCAALDAHAARVGRCPPLVVDPVMIAASGATLAGAEAMGALRQELLPRATVLTPNLPEAAALLGLEAHEVSSLEQMRSAADALRALGPSHVLVKGGHLGGGSLAVDVLSSGGGAGGGGGPSALELPALRVPTPNDHGTGCTLSTAIAAHLARGASVREAVLGGKMYLTSALAASAALRLGKGAHGPMDHAFATSALARVRAEPPATAAARLAARRARTREAMALYAVTDAELSARVGMGVVDAAIEALGAGVSCVQLRDKHNAARLAEHASALLPAARAAGVPLIINDRVDVMLATGADGVHVGQEDLPARAARALIGPDKLLGVSVSGSLDDARRALADGADYVGVGAMFASPTKPDKQAIGPAALGPMREVVGELPMVAIGGIDATNAAACIEAGADGVALVSGVFGSTEVKARTAALRALVDGALGARRGGGQHKP